MTRMRRDTIGLVRGEGYRMLAPVSAMSESEESLSGHLWSELGRRRVLRTAIIYAAAAWSTTEALSYLIDNLPVFPEWSKTLVAILFVVGFPVAMFLAWRFDVGPDGISRTQAGSTEGRLTIVAASLLLVGATAGLVLFDLSPGLPLKLNWPAADSRTSQPLAATRSPCCRSSMPAGSKMTNTSVTD